MDRTQAISNLQATLKAYEDSPIPAEGVRDSSEFHNLNTAIRYALPLLGEDAMSVETLENRGLFTGPGDQPVPDSFVPGVQNLIADLQVP